MKYKYRLVESLNLKSGSVYSDIELRSENHTTLGNIDGIFVGDDKIGVVQLKNIDGISNVISSIFIKPEYRGKSYAIPTYVALAMKYGNVYSGEYNIDGSKTSFISDEADKVWDRLNNIFDIDKVEIENGRKFRYKLDKTKI